VRINQEKKGKEFPALSFLASSVERRASSVERRDRAPGSSAGIERRDRQIIENIANTRNIDYMIQTESMKNLEFIETLEPMEYLPAMDNLAYMMNIIV
jgi:hypothetical protein